jgi:hypothetical protein
MDDEPRAFHFVKHHENPTLRKAPGSECMCQVIAFILPWWLFMDGPSYHSRPNVDPSDHRLEYARTRSTGVLSRKIHRSRTSIENQAYIW